MTIKEVGFRPLYHLVCAFELNDKLKEIIKDCPDAAKASHAVVYGYIDPTDGLMLEVLGAGKQAPKYFYFKDPYEGERITIKASEVEDVEFMYFPDLEPRFKKKFTPRIEELKKYDADEKLEETRKLGFLDELRSPQFPDDVKVVLMKEGLKPEEVWVHMTEPGDHEIIGVLLNQPYQDYGVNKGDTIGFNVKETDDKKILCFKDLNEPRELRKEDLEDGSFLQHCIQDFLSDTENKEKFGFLLAVLRSSNVVVPCDVQLSDEAEAIMNKLKKAGKELDDMTEEEAEVFNAGMHFFPMILENETHKFMPAFTGEEEIGDHADGAARVNMPFLHAIDMALDEGNELEGIVINPYSDNFIVSKELFGTIRKMEPLFDEPDGFGSEGNHQNFTNRKDLALAIGVGKMDVFNYALYENDVPPIRGLRIINDTGDPIDGLSIRISSNFNFFKPYEKALPSIPSGKPIDLPDPHLSINGKELAGMTESVNAEILVELCKGGETLCGVRGQMQVLAYDQWQGGETYRDILPAFVLPNHPLIPALMHDAADRLAKWNKPTSLEGYQAHDPNRVRDLAAAAYAAIQKKNIVYAEPPASFSVMGQRIRTPETIMEQRLGTCMDMTLLYAALLEAMGLHPLLVMLKGHIFAGVWLKERSVEELKASDVVIDNLEQLTMRIDTGSDEMTFVECTAMCSGKQVNFEDAERKAKQENLDPDDFQFAIDVYLSRVHGIKPIASRMKDGGEYQIEVTEKEDDELTEAPTDLGITITDFTTVKPRKITNKRELWESKLLDLSSHNMLLNLPINASVEPIMSSHIDELEDALSDGHEFNLLPAAEWITELAYTKKDEKGKESKPIQWLPEALKERGVFEMTSWPVSADFDFNEKFRQEYRNHRLYTFCGTKQLDRELTSIYRAARSSQQENGVSSLYLAVGLLRWFAEPDSKEPCYAPLILVPIEIIRKSANQGYALHARDEEPHFNTTLLEMLKQNFNLEIPGLDPLPMDDHGTNIKKVFSIVRSALFTVKNWDVVETCVIGNFSFAQFAMWNDIHTAGEVLDNSKIVRSLMKGHVDWDVEISDDVENDPVYLPITVDATQLKAIKMAAHGTTFVLHGPPGTGKSQTITGMIANLMGQGKRVLFVAEKMAALSVVQRRLTSLGIGDFCLELHSDKANKKQVLTQLDKALAIQHPSRRTEYEESLRKTVESREKIDGYAEHLHQRHNCGYSLRELIALYETVRDVEKIVRFDRDRVGELTKDDLKAHIPLIGQLTAAGGAVSGGIAGNKLIGVGLTAYSAEVRSQLKRVAEQYQMALSRAKEAGDRVAGIVGSNSPKNQADLSGMSSLVVLYQEKRGTEPLLLQLLKTGTSEAYGYFDKKETDTAVEMVLLNDWKPEFLKMDMNTFLAKHEAAGKKFFGKAGAMAQITAEIQAYANRQLTYEQIPAMLRKIIEHQNQSGEVVNAYNALSDNTKSLLKELPNREAYSKAYAAACDCQKQAERFPGGLDAIMGISGNADNAKAFDELGVCIEQLDQAEKRMNELLCREENTSENWFEEEQALCEYLIDNPASLKDWGLYNQVRQECIRVGLEPVVKAYENELSANELAPAYRKGLYYALINNIIMQDDILSSFSGATFNEAIAQFKKLDDAMLEQTKKEIYYRLASNVPTAFGSPEIGMELNLLRKAIGSNARGMSIRNLFDRIPNILPLLCPCMLMSPNSVAQYLAQDNDLFDVVIFDEASQLPTCKAVGALSRAKDAVIVGDPKQMPPTSFFSGGGPEVDDLALDDLDSILDDALALGIPSQHLQWHYRSTHESLIAFSNNQFYENKMFTFPSANDREHHVTAVHVEGLYNKSTNPKEAEAVVEEVVRRFNDPELKKQSIGVVTFNMKQQTLIENLLAKQFQSNPELDVWANSGDDPLFVKNLENVQGDERDAILFSIGYGPDEKGHVSNNFGPINKPGGGKRLNVAFSRARVSMTIFSSIYSTDIKVTDTSPDGLVAFRDFLKFAEGHDIQSESSAEKQAKLAKAGIMQNICKAIENAGFQYVTMVGHSDFHVDIAVVDPTNPSRYMMGILLDGDGYRQTKNTRDREIAQIGVLKNLGWNLLRVWTIDWWDNRDKELNMILSKLNQLKEEAERKFEQQKAEEEARKAEEAAREAEAQRLKAELEAQAAEVIAEDEEADKEKRTVEAPVIVSSEESKEKTENKTVEFTVPEKKAEPIEDPTGFMKKPEQSEATPKVDVPAASQGDSELGMLIQELQAAKGKIIDKRANGGALWVVGGKDLAPIMKKFKAHGIYFIFKTGGGKATGGKDGWWAKTDVVLPAPGTKSAVIAAPDTTRVEPVVEEDLSSKNDVGDSISAVTAVITSAGFQIMTYASDVRTITVKDSDNNSIGDIHIGNAKCVISLRAKYVPDGFTADRVRNCPNSHAFDIPYDDLSKLENILLNIKSKPEESDIVVTSVAPQSEPKQESTVTVSEVSEPVEYLAADIPVTPISPAEFAANSNKNSIADRILAVVNTEAPILKDALMRKIFASYGVQKSGATAEAFEKALRASKVKTTKQKGNVYCWSDAQDPKTYAGIRISTDRSGDEICQQEIRNAICYVLGKNGVMGKDDLIKETSLLFGYKRLGKNLEAALLAGLQWAKSSGAIASAGTNKFELAKGEVPVVDDTATITEMPVQEEVIPVAIPEPKVASAASDKPAELNIVIPDGQTAFFCEGEDYKAAAVKAGVEFVVLKGSKISGSTTPSCPDTVVKTREKHSDIIGADFIIGDDIKFSSPSGAACFVAGASRNGYTEWHTKDGTQLKDLH